MTPQERFEKTIEEIMNEISWCVTRQWIDVESEVKIWRELRSLCDQIASAAISEGAGDGIFNVVNDLFNGK